MKAEQLRKAILQMAIQGKLVPQDRSDEPASVLLEKIRAEKERLIKQGKIKKDKNDSVIFKGEDGKFYEKIGKEIKDITEELPFEIPDIWVWIKHNEIFEISGGAQPPKSKFVNEPQKGYIRLYQIRDYGPNPQPIYIPEYTASKVSKKGDILLARYGASLGKVFWAEAGAYNVAMAKSIPLFDIRLIDKSYLYYFYKSSIYQEIVMGNARSAQAGFNKEDLSKMFFPLPPLNEQKRIVEAIEKFEPLLAEYDKLEQQATKLDNEIFDKIKKSILQYAIQGKLVPQDSSDEPASVLLAKIKAEKESLIKQGKIKKEKLLPPITDDEKPFDIPDSWEWARLRDIVFNRGQIIPKDKFSYIDIGSIDNKKQKLNEEENIIEANNAPSRARKIVGQGDILYSTVRPYLHNMCIVNNNFSYMPIASTGFAVLTCCIGVYNKFLFYYLMAPIFDKYANSAENAKGVAYPAINDDRLYRAVVPLPPLDEQKRIVARIEEIFVQIDKINTGNIKK